MGNVRERSKRETFMEEKEQLHYPASVNALLIDIYSSIILTIVTKSISLSLSTSSHLLTYSKAYKNEHV